MILVVGGLLLTAGCDLFTTRDPEDPISGGTPAEIATSPDEVMDRLQASVQLRDPELYMIVIDDEFRYEATPSAYEDVLFFAQWGVDDEDRFIRQLLSPGILPADSTAEWNFEEVDRTEWGDSVLFRESYRLEVHMTLTELPQVYEGLAQLLLWRGDDGGWRIRRWLDDSGGDAPSMSRLRAAL
jgi:hypothetical protein